MMLLVFFPGWAQNFNCGPSVKRGCSLDHHIAVVQEMKELVHVEKSALNHSICLSIYCLQLGQTLNPTPYMMTGSPRLPKLNSTERPFQAEDVYTSWARGRS